MITTLNNCAPLHTLMEMKTQTYDSPCGRLVLGSVGENLCLCDWNVLERGDKVRLRLHKYLNAAYIDEPTSITTLTATQLDEYFNGRRMAFDLPLLVAGTTFQTAIWEHLETISYGATTTYKQFVSSIGKSNAVRAVASAIGQNALAIILPCHRVIGSNMSLRGFRGGIEAKRFLLDMEERYR